MNTHRLLEMLMAMPLVVAASSGSVIMSGLVLRPKVKKPAALIRNFMVPMFWCANPTKLSLKRKLHSQQAQALVIQHLPMVVSPSLIIQQRALLALRLTRTVCMATPPLKTLVMVQPRVILMVISITRIRAFLPSASNPLTMKQTGV